MTANAATDEETRAPPWRLMSSFVAFFMMLVSLTGLLHYYVGVRLISQGFWPESIKIWLWVVLWAFYALTPTAMIAGRFLRGPVVQAMRWCAYAWLGFYVISLISVSFVDVVTLVSHVVPNLPSPPKFYTAIALTLVGLLYGFLSARSHIQLKEVVVKIPTLPQSAEIRLVQMSDLHIGETLGSRFLQRVLDIAKNANPHALVITGDMVDGAVHHVEPQLFPLKEFSSQHPTFFVTGNHEYYHGGPEWERCAAGLGMNVLHNSHSILNGTNGAIALGGITDLQAAQFHPGHGPDVKKAFDGAPAGVPRVLLSHQPRSAKLAEGHNVSLQLSGHTHGGQIFPLLLFVRLQQPVVAGLRKIFNTLVYTSRGTGYWGPPFRVFAPPEVTLIRLLGEASV